MKQNTAIRTAGLLRVLVCLTFAVNLLCLPCVPYLTMMVLFFREYTQTAYWVLLVAFFWGCGGCTAVILWQAKRILDTILAGNPFQAANARSMNRAAVCCWVISGASAVRLAAELMMFQTPLYLFGYNTVFIPCFFMAGLLFRVMGALFQQASELQEDQDLTI